MVRQGGRMRAEEESRTTTGLRMVNWAASQVDTESTLLRIGHEPRPLSMSGAPYATGLPLVSNGTLGVDAIRLPAGSGFAPHTHPGHHILIAIAGKGAITYDGKIYGTVAGQVYLVEGAVPHAVGAITDHVLLAVGSPHKSVDALDRMTSVAYDEVLAPDGDLHCLICDIRSWPTKRVHELGCPHCPCTTCVGLV